MYFKGVIIVAGIVFVSIAAILVATIYSEHSLVDSKDSNLSNAYEIATNFVKTSPTFSFDGMEDSFEIKLISASGSHPEQYVFEVKFSSLYAGYGDRTDMIISEEITPHTMEIVIVYDEIISAVIDGQWDEMNQIPCRAVSC